MTKTDSERQACPSATQEIQALLTANRLDEAELLCADLCSREPGWDEQCLNYHANRRPILSASYNDVRKPIYRRSVGRWWNYQAQLEPLRAVLEASGASAD